MNHEKLQPLTKQTLVNQLNNFGIDTKLWGTGEAKTVDHLLKELEDGESRLVKSKDKLIRQLRIVSIDVSYTNPDGILYKLKEDRQVFNDGRIRKRNLTSAVHEKMLPHEHAIQCAHRAMQEELGIGDIFNLYERKACMFSRISNSYPGLESQYLQFPFSLELNHDQFKPEGYREVQTDKTTYFIWKQIDTSKVIN